MELNRFGAKKKHLLALVLAAGLLLGRYLFPGWKFPDNDPGAQASMVQVIYVTKYSKCNDTATITKDVGKDQLDSLLASLSEGWAAMEERDGKLELVRVINDWCPNHNHYRLIKLHRGHVVVFRGQDPDDRFIIRGYREFEESLIEHSQTLEQLRQGILLFDEDPEYLDMLVRSYLEGITD
ncbi:MAG: hypothetical protein ACOX34_02735 [Bacillota bacterium]|jgi:hypothetical protein|nr:hypothetical protein [Candidatus Fermentithermobacillaceae bacterium]